MLGGTVDDGYVAASEYLHIFSLAPWRALRPALTAALAGVRPAEGPVVDIGAGTGLGVEVVLDAVPGARVLAVEPSAGLRAVLLARVAANPDRARRTTVLPMAVASAPLPDRVGGVIMMNMVGHLAPEERRTLWQRLGRRLAPGAPLVVGLQEPHQATAVPRTRFGEVTIGDLRYQCYGAAEPTAPDAVRWTMEYRTVDGETVLAQSTACHDWWVVPEATLLAELAAAGLSGRSRDRELVVARLGAPKEA